MSFRNQTRRWNRQMLSWVSPKQLALLLCIALDRKFEDLFYFE